VCQCPPCHSGQFCELKNPCCENPCQNGLCVTHGNNFVCQCPPGFSGNIF
jgi:Notch-like protein